MNLSIRKTVKWDLIRGTGGHYVVCEVLRMIYDEVYSLPKKKRDKITELLTDAMIMTKKMSNRLHYYHDIYGDKSGHKGRHIKRIGDYRERRTMRLKRKVC